MVLGRCSVTMQAEERDEVFVPPSAGPPIPASITITNDGDDPLPVTVGLEGLAPGQVDPRAGLGDPSCRQPGERPVKGVT